MTHDELAPMFGDGVARRLLAAVPDGFAAIESPLERDIHRRRWVIDALRNSGISEPEAVELAEVTIRELHDVRANIDAAGGDPVVAFADDAFPWAVRRWWYPTVALAVRLADVPDDPYHRVMEAAFAVAGTVEQGHEPLRPLLIAALVARGGTYEGDFGVFEDEYEMAQPNAEPLAILSQVRFAFWEVLVEPVDEHYGRRSSTSDALRLALRIDRTIELDEDVLERARLAVGDSATLDEYESTDDSVLIVRDCRLGEPVDRVVDDVLVAGDAANAIVGRFVNLPRITRIEGLD